MNNNYYAGVGSRETPDHILNIMHHIGAYLASEGWTLRSGAASGADHSFEEGALTGPLKPEIYLPWAGYNNHKSELHPRNHPFTQHEMAFAAKMHPMWRKCSPSARLMHQRNGRIILGAESIHGVNVQASRFVVAWTERGLVKGGTGQALRIAQSMRIPVINLGAAHNAEELEQLVLKVDEIQNALKNKVILG